MRTAEHRRDDGFTLVELLTVTVIIATLAAIVTPTFLGQRSKAARAAMKADLHSAVAAQTAWLTEHSSPTADVADLETEGYRQTPGVSTAHLKVTGDAWVACVWHQLANSWLTYDSSTSSTSESSTDCAA